MALCPVTSTIKMRCLSSICHFPSCCSLFPRPSFLCNLASDFLPSSSLFLFKRQSVFCFLVSRGFHATQGMEFDSSVRWLAPGVAGSATTGGEVAQSIEATASGTCEARTGHQSISCEGTQFGGSVGRVGARRFDHEGGSRGSSETCERGMCCHGVWIRTPESPPGESGLPGWREPSQRWGISRGPEVTSLRTGLKRAQKDAQELPVEVQIREREAFIERARKSIAKIDEDRLSEVRSLEEAERKLIKSAIPGRFRSPSVAKHGFAIAGSSRQFEGSSWFGQARSKPQVGVPSGGFCAPLRRGDARVDGVATEGRCLTTRRPPI